MKRPTKKNFYNTDINIINETNLWFWIREVHSSAVDLVYFAFAESDGLHRISLLMLALPAVLVLMYIAIVPLAISAKRHVQEVTKVGGGFLMYNKANIQYLTIIGTLQGRDISKKNSDDYSI